MRRSCSFLRLPLGSRAYHGDVRRALVASAWSLLPGVFAPKARESRAPHTAMLRVDSSDANGSNRGVRNGRNDDNKEEEGAARLFFRRGRTARQTSGTSPDADAGGDVQRGTTAKTTSGTDNRVLRAFNRWAEKNGGCNANEFVQGVHQSYYSLGVLCETLAEAAKPQLPLGKTIPLAGALAQLKTLLSKEYGISPKDLDNEVKAVAEKPGKERRETSKVVAEALKQVLPISHELGESMYNMWNKQRLLDSNVLRIAAPNDYILSAKMIFFHECNNAKEVHFVDNSQLSVVMAMRFANREEKPSRRGDNVYSDNKVASTAAGAAASEEEKEIGRKSATSNSEKTINNNNNNKGQTIITFRGRSLPTIPANAVACAVASIDVVTPPQRYDPSFEWYYQRITGHENEYQRIAVARFFAMSNAKAFLAPFDFLARMLTGRHLELTCPPGISDLIGIPKNIAECPPAMRKLLCYYMDANGRWVLSDLLWVDAVTTPLVQKSPPA